VTLYRVGERAREREGESQRKHVHICDSYM